ncbi:MAG: hemin uptake protein HemP [Pseudomonadota bacterium]
MQEVPGPAPSLQQLSEAATRQPEAKVRTVSSETLLQGARTVDIDHNGSIYRLQATRLGKLILTK